LPFFFLDEKEWQMKILTQFGIFIRIIILTIGGKKAHTQYFFIYVHIYFNYPKIEKEFRNTCVLIK